MTRPLPHWTLTLWTLCNVLNILSGVRTHCIGTDNGYLSLCNGSIFVLDSAQNKTSATFSRQLCQQLWDFVYIEEYDTALQQYIHSVRRGVVKSFLRSYFFFEVEIMWFIMSLCTSKAWSCTRSRSKMFYFDISVPIICTKGGKLESVVIQIIFGFLLAFLYFNIDSVMKTQYSEKALGLSFWRHYWIKDLCKKRPYIWQVVD